MSDQQLIIEKMKADLRAKFEISAKVTDRSKTKRVLLF